jgi:hypothetical protein
MKKYLLFSIIFSFLLFYGCGNKTENKTDNKGDKTNEQMKTDDKKNDTASKKDETAGDKKNVNELGLKESFPADFPADIPQPKNSKFFGSVETSDGNTVTFETSENVKDIFDFYKDQMKKSGYDMGEGGDSLVRDKGGLIGWKKGNKEVGLMVSYNDEHKSTQVVITYK